MNGLRQALQGQILDRLDAHGVLRRREHPLADQDLPRGRRVAQARGQVCHRADRGVVGASLEADPPERRVALRDPEAEVQVVALLLPPSASSLTRSRIARAILTARNAGSSQGTGSLKKTIRPSPVNRSSVPSKR